MSANKQATSGGIGLLSAIFLIFLTLKLVGVEPVASWSWWWVTAPLWGPVGLVIGIGLGVLSAALAIDLVQAPFKYLRYRKAVRALEREQEPTDG